MCPLFTGCYFSGRSKINPALYKASGFGRTKTYEPRLNFFYNSDRTTIVIKRSWSCCFV